MRRKILFRGAAILLLSMIFTALLTSLTLSAAATSTPPVAVLTQHNDTSRTGAVLSETLLNTSNVNVSQFGKIFTRTVDGQIYAQPLYVPGVTIPGQGVHNVVYVATMHNSLYAFDADDPGAATPLWQANLGPSAPLPSPDIGPYPNYFDISLEVGALSTPVIDPSSNTIYAVAFNKDSPSSCSITCTYNYRLHALDLTTGAEKFGGPTVITGTYPGCGWDNSFCVLTFNPPRELQRTGLLLSNGILYFAFASFGDQAPSHGWVFGYDATTLQRVSIFNASPNGGYAGVWQSGQGLAVDTAGYLYFITGNGTFDADTNGGDYGDSIIKLDPSNVVGGILPVADWFTPYDQAYLDANDIDLGSGGPLLIPDTNLLLGGGKEGKLYLLNRNNMGHYNGPAGPDNVVQSFQVTSLVSNTGHIHGSPVYWNSPTGPLVYVWGEGDALKAFSLTVFSPISATFLTTPIATGTTQLDPYFMPGGILSISADGNTSGSGIVWASHPMTNANESISLGVLRAYDAANVGVELWNSRQNLARDDVGNYAKFCPPTVADGKVYLATFSNQLAVYGLLAPSIVNEPVGQTINPKQLVTLSVTAAGQGPLSYQWYVGNSGDTSHPIGGAQASSYTTSTLTSSTSFWVHVSNTAGSINSATAFVTVNQPPTILTQPLTQTITSRHSVTLTVVATGTLPLSYQWYVGNSGDTHNPIGGALLSSYTTSTLTSSTSFWVRASNIAGSVDSTTALVTVNQPPSIVTQPLTQTITSGQSVTLTVAATGTLPLAYQWYVGNSGNTTNPISGAQASSYTTSTLASSTSFWVRVSNIAGSVDSTTALVTVNHPPRILTQPLTQTITSGQSVTLTVVASSTLSLSYQWYIGNSGDTSHPINGAIESTYTTSTLKSTTLFWVQVSNVAGSTNSDTATVVIPYRVYMPLIKR